MSPCIHHVSMKRRLRFLLSAVLCFAIISIVLIVNIKPKTPNFNGRIVANKSNVKDIRLILGDKLMDYNSCFENTKFMPIRGDCPLCLFGADIVFVIDNRSVSKNMDDSVISKIYVEYFPVFDVGGPDWLNLIVFKVIDFVDFNNKVTVLTSL